MKPFTFISHLKWFIVLVLVCINCNFAQLIEGSGKDSNESFGEITLPIPNFTGAFHIFVSSNFYIMHKQISLL